MALQHYNQLIMVPSPEEIDPYKHDPDRWGTSMAQMVSLLVPSLDAVSAKYVVEVGAYGGDLTSVLAAWAESSGARIAAIDPSPQPALVELAAMHPNVELIRAKSLDALGAIERPDAVVLDGDHNYYSVISELNLIAENAGEEGFPLVLMHDVCWPHARRDDYFDSTQIPADFVQPVIGGSGGIVPGNEGIVTGGGLPYVRSAKTEGGLRNGVLTAAEDFVRERPTLRLAVVPAFFGLGAIWPIAAPWASTVEPLFAPFDRSLLMERLEENRVIHVARAHSRLIEIWELRDRLVRQEALLDRLLDSSAITVAEKLSRLRLRAGVASGQDAISKDEIRRVRSC